MLEPLFRRLDSNSDGSLTVKEYRRISASAHAAGGGPLAKKKAAGAFAKGALAKRKAAAGGAAPKPRPSPREATERSVTPEQATFFETKIRPVLMNKCAKCHSSTAEKIKGGLLVDSRDGLRKGGDTETQSCPASPMRAF